MKHFIHTVLAKLFYADELEKAVKGIDLRELAHHKNSRVRQRVAECINSPVPPTELWPRDVIYNTVCDRLSYDPCRYVRLALAENPSVEPSHLKRILIHSFSDNDNKVKLALLRREDLPEDPLTLLEGDNDDLIRSLVAGHPNTSKASLERLSEDKSPEVRFWVATNPNTSKETLQSFLLPEGEESRVSLSDVIMSIHASRTLLEMEIKEELASNLRKERLESQLKVEIQK